MNKNKLYESIEKYGLNHKETIEASQELDKEVVREQLELLARHNKNYGILNK